MLQLVASLIALGFASAAQAIVPDASRAAQMPEIVVTARRTEEALAQVPVAVTVFDASEIDRIGADSLGDLAQFTPGFSFESAAGRGPNSNRPAMRGLTTIRNGIANSTVAATFIDGVYLGGSSQSTSLYDVERVEILRGPQSAQFGRATYAGAINYVTRPATAEFAAGASATGAEHDTLRADGWMSGPIAGDRLRLFVGAGYDRYGGEYRNTRDGSTVGGQEQRDASLKLQAEPADGLAVTLRLAFQQTDDDHYAVWLQPRTANNCCFRSADSPRSREYYVGDALVGNDVTLYTDYLDAAGGSGFELDRRLGSLALEWQPSPDGYTLTSLTGFVDDELERGFDVSYGAYEPVPAAPGTFLQRDRLEQSDFSQELRVASPRGRALSWNAGLYWYRGKLDDAERTNVWVFDDGSFSTFPNPAGLTLNDIENRAVFGALEAALPRDVTAGIELRYAADEVEVTSPQCNASAPCRDTFRGLTPRFTLSWQATPALMPYLNVARGQSPGTFNPDVPDEQYRVVDEESIWSYELGLRGTFPDQRTRFAAALYHLDVDDQQYTHIVERDDGSTLSVLDNVGRSRVNGAELELATTFGDSLSARLAYAWTDAEIREQVSEDWADLQGGNGSIADLERLGSVAGHKLPRVPKHAASLQLEYRRPYRGANEWFVGGDWAYESSRYAQEDNLIETGDRSLLGVQAGFTWRSTEFTAWVDNLTDDDTPIDVQRYIDRRYGFLPSCQSYVNAGTAPPGTVCARSSTTPRGFAITLPRGRQAGVTVRYRF